MPGAVFLYAAAIRGSSAHVSSQDHFFHAAPSLSLFLSATITGLKHITRQASQRQFTMGTDLHYVNIADPVLNL